MSKPFIIGLVGGIGGGKSQVARELVKHGGHLISGDALGHEALTQEDIKVKITNRWGRDILDEKGEIQRRKLGAVVFADVNELRALEALVFPYIGKRIREEIARAGLAPFVVLDAAVMTEAGWDGNCDAILFVDAPADVRMRRLSESRGWTETEVIARERAQLPLEEKRRRADYVIDNGGRPEVTAPQIAKVLENLNIK